MGDIERPGKLFLVNHFCHPDVTNRRAIHHQGVFADEAPLRLSVLRLSVLRLSVLPLSVRSKVTL